MVCDFLRKERQRAERGKRGGKARPPLKELKVARLKVARPVRRKLEEAETQKMPPLAP